MMIGKGISKRHAAWLISILFLPVFVTLITGCAPKLRVPQINGLMPINPKVAVLRKTGSIVFTAVDSLTPILKWEGLAPPAEAEADKDALFERITEITYDLNIWKVGIIPYRPEAVEAVYEREGLTKSVHKVEKSLRPGTRYIWTVRARFLLDGKSRATVWGASKEPLYIHRGNLVPDPNYFRFKTPAEIEDIE